MFNFMVAMMMLISSTFLEIMLISDWPSVSVNIGKGISVIQNINKISLLYYHYLATYIFTMQLDTGRHTQKAYVHAYPKPENQMA